MNESDIMRELERALCSCDSPVRVWRQNAGLSRVDGRVVRGAPAGAADLTGIVLPHGWRIELEVKAVTGRVSLAQRRWGAMIERHGGIYIVCRGPDIRAHVEAVHAAVAARAAR